MEKVRLEYAEKEENTANLCFCSTSLLPINLQPDLILFFFWLVVGFKDI